jgi:tagatose 6-phosphate kinase
MSRHAYQNPQPVQAMVKPAASGPVLVVGVTPGLQRTWFFRHWHPGRVNRAERVVATASGKGANVVRVLARLGTDAVWLGFVGGAAGERYLAFLAAEGLAAAPVWSEGETRTCETVVDRHGGEVTELVEEAPTPAGTDWERLAREMEDRLSGARAVVVTGTLPPGAPTDAYRRLLRPAAEAGLPLFVDTHGEALHEVAALAPALVKINAEELVRSLPASDREGGMALGLQAGVDVLRRAGAERVLITRGARPAILSSDGGTWRYAMPEVQTVNPIGSGDAALAGVVHARGIGCAWEDAVRFGLACGTANALTDTPGIVCPDTARRLETEIITRRVDGD